MALNGMTFEGQIRKIGDKFRIKSYFLGGPGGGKFLRGESHYTYSGRQNKLRDRYSVMQSDGNSFLGQL